MMASFKYFLFVERSGGPSKCPTRSRTQSSQETLFFGFRPLRSVRSRQSRMTADFGTPRVAASCSISRSSASGNLSEMVVMVCSVIPPATGGNTMQQHVEFADGPRGGVVDLAAKPEIGRVPAGLLDEH